MNLLIHPARPFLLLQKYDSAFLVLDESEAGVQELGHELLIALTTFHVGCS